MHAHLSLNLGIRSKVTVPHQPTGGSQEMALLLLEEDRSKVKGKNKWSQTHLARPADVNSDFTTLRGAEGSGS